MWFERAHDFVDVIVIMLLLVLLTREKMLNLQPVFAEQGWKKCRFTFFYKRMHNVQSLLHMHSKSGRQFI